MEARAVRLRYSGHGSLHPTKKCHVPPEGHARREAAALGKEGASLAATGSPWYGTVSWLLLLAFSCLRATDPTVESVCVAPTL